MNNYGIFNMGILSTSGVFSPSSLNLNLDLRTPNEVLTLETKRTNGLICMTNGGNPDVSCIIDQSKNKAVKANIYTSDFSAGVDGWLNLSGTTISGNNDGIGGEDDWAELTCDSSTSTHRSYHPTGSAISKVLKFSIQVRIPSSNSVVDGFRIEFGQFSNVFFDFDSITPDTTHTFSGYIYTLLANATLRIHAKSGTSNAFGGANGDKIYFKSVITDEIDGFHRTQDVAAKMGHWDNTNFTIDLDGVDDEYEDYDGVFTSISSDTKGHFFLSYDDDEGTGSILTPLSFGDSTGANYFIRSHFGSDDKIYIQVKNISTNTILFSTGVETRSGRNYHFWGSDDSNYLLRLNGVNKSVQSGTDDGKIQGDVVNLDNMGLSTLPVASKLFYSSGFKAVGYRSGAIFTEQEMIDYETFTGL